MGAPMVAQLRQGGFEVRVHDSDHDRAARLAATTGASVAARLADLSGVEVVICMLPNSNVVDQVVGAGGGLLDLLSRGSLIVDMGSSQPDHTIRLEALASDRGIGLVDAPVSGGVARARTGELTVMFGGAADVLERARPLLEAVGSQIFHVGPVGSGHALKSLNNLLSAIGLTAAAEVIEVGRRFGLDPTVMLEVINTSTGRNHATETKIAQQVLNEQFASGFLLRLMLKDIGIASEIARSQGVSTPLGDACVEIWKRAAETQPPDADQTAIARLPQAGGPRDA